MCEWLAANGLCMHDDDNVNDSSDRYGKCPYRYGTSQDMENCYAYVDWLKRLYGMNAECYVDDDGTLVEYNLQDVPF